MPCAARHAASRDKRQSSLRRRLSAPFAVPCPAQPCQAPALLAGYLTDIAVSISGTGLGFATAALLSLVPQPGFPCLSWPCLT